MTPKQLAGATYGAFWPDGIGYISLTLPAGLESPLLYFRVSADGRVVGKAQSGNATPYWNGSRWLDLGSCTGVNVAAFHPTSGEVYVSDAAGVRVSDRDGRFVRLLPGYIGSQGIRWVNADGSVVSGDETYGVTGLLGEHFRVGELRIGQGLKGGLDVVDGNGAVRHVCDGRVDFLQVNAVGDAVACYWTDFRDGYLLQTSLSALRALPTVQPAPVPQPDPVPVPQPKPEPPPVSLPDPAAVKAALDVARKKYPAAVIGNAEMGDILNTAAAQFPNMGMHRKDGQATQPGTGIGISHDILRYLPPGDDLGWWSDVLGATGVGQATPQAPEWKRSTDDSRSFVPALLGSNAPPVPVPIPVPPPAPSVDLSAVLARLDLMDKRNAQEFAVQRAATADTMQTLLRIAESLDALRTATQLPVVFPNYSGTARLGTSMRFTLEPVKT